MIPHEPDAATAPFRLHGWENNIAEWCTKIKPAHLENSEYIISSYTSDNPKLYINPVFQRYENA